MAGAKDITLKVIPSAIANDFIKGNHYSGKVVQNSALHFGAFLDNRLHGAMSFGPPIDKRKVLGLVADTNGNPAKWNEMLELNRMAFDAALPKNSESRCISVAVRLIRKNAPHIRWIISFADGMQCGDGTIYRASGFKLTGFSCGSMWRLPESLVRLNGGPVAHEMKIHNKSSPISHFILSQTNGRYPSMKQCAERWGGQLCEGFMLRYIKILDPAYHLTVPEIPFSEIAQKGAGMYKGQKR